MSESKAIEVMHRAAAVPAPGNETHHEQVPDFSEKSAYLLTVLLLVVLVGIPYAWRGLGELQVWLELRGERAEYTEAYEARMDAYERLSAITLDAPEARPEAENLGSVEAIDLAIRQEKERTAYLERTIERRKEQVANLQDTFVEAKRYLAKSESETSPYDRIRAEQAIREVKATLTADQLAEATARLTPEKTNQD